MYLYEVPIGTAYRDDKLAIKPEVAKIDQFQRVQLSSTPLYRSAARALLLVQRAV